MITRQDYKLADDYRGKSNLQYFEWNNKKLKDCATNRR